MSESNVRAFLTGKVDRTPSEVLRDALSVVEAHSADGKALDVVVILTHPDPEFWPKFDWSCAVGDLAVAAATFQAVANHAVLDSMFEDED